MSPAVPLSMASSSTIVHSLRGCLRARRVPVRRRGRAPRRRTADRSRPKGAEWHAEQAEHADLAPGHRQAQRAHRARQSLPFEARRCDSRRQFAERGQIGQARGPHAARTARRLTAGRDQSGSRLADVAEVRRMGCGRRPAPSPGSENAAAMVATRPVETCLAGQLGMERGGHDLALSGRRRHGRRRAARARRRRARRARRWALG